MERLGVDYQAKFVSVDMLHLDAFGPSEESCSFWFIYLNF